MEGAFTHMGNHLVSDSAATINAGAGDDESILDHGLTGARRRRIGEEDDETDIYDDDDMESMASMPVGGPNGKPAMRAEEE
jgi:regulator of nonsense transcripts 1